MIIITNLYQRHNYLNKDLTFLKSTIIEYDMSEGGFSLIQEFELLPQETIDYLKENFDKKGRHIEIGKMIADDKELSKDLMEAFVGARQLFFQKNNIEEYEVLSIKKDAIFIINKPCKKLKFGKFIEFKPKNKYSHYINLNNIEFFYSIWEDKLDVKGLGKHSHLLLDKIKYFLKVNSKLNRNDMYKLLQKFRREYLSLDLDLEFYREMSKDSIYDGVFNFKLKKTLKQSDIYLVELPEDLLEYVDITYNYVNYIIPLINNFI